MTTSLQFDEAFLYSDLDFATPHNAAGHRLHGGFDPSGEYLPPRARGRSVALEAWLHALRERGGDLFDADTSLLVGPTLPNVEQQRLLLREGVGQPFWDVLTITGKIEGRGRLLAEMSFPELQPIIEDDVSTMAIGHLNKGLLVIHGIDEGGEPEKGIGGHDVMWFAARDLAFGAGAYPDAEPPESIGRPATEHRWMPQLAPEYEGMLSFLMNLLMIEFRAELGFSNTQAILRSPDLFVDRRAEAAEAAEIVGRIRTDEEIHVRSLRLYLGELRQCTLRTLDGRRIKGAELIDPFWQGLVEWATLEQPVLTARARRDELVPLILEQPGGESLLARFDALADPT